MGGELVGAAEARSVRELEDAAGGGEVICKRSRRANSDCKVKRHGEGEGKGVEGVRVSVHFAIE